jgi:hypothetical protein
MKYPHVYLAYILTAILLLYIAYRCIPVKESFTEYILPKIAWTHWDTAHPPKIIHDIIVNRAKKMIGWQTIVLTDDTIGQYIDINTLPSNFWNLSAPHRADWIRLAVLVKHGGVWMDAGIIVNDSSAMDRLHDETLTRESLFTGFYPNHPSYIDNWFIMAPKGSPLIREWLAEYEKAINMGFVAYKVKLLETPTVFSEYSSDPKDVYLTAQACLQYILQRSPAKSKNIILHNATYSMMKIHADCSHNKSTQAECIRDTILYDPSAKKIPYIKLRKEDRIFDIEPYF